MNGQSPLLVTGAHRSGTTWVGKILTADSRQVGYISEPLNVLHRPGVMRQPVFRWYTYLCEDNQQEYLPALRETLRFRYHPALEIKSLRSLKDAGRMGRDFAVFLRARFYGARPLLKDPFAVFSAPWFAQTLGCRVVIVVRSPLAVVSSLKRLGWIFDFGDLLSQPLLMRDRLSPFREAMETCPRDVIAQGSLLWRMVYSVVDGFRASHPEFVVLRHEDLSLRPEEGFRALYAALGLDFNHRVRQTLLKSSRQGNPGELSPRRVHAVTLDSAANLLNWKKRLTPDEIARIRHLTADIAHRFYPEEFWKEL